MISLPLGMRTAVYLTEVGGRFAGVVRTVVEAMTALPDIVAGLFVYAVLILALGAGAGGFAAAVALGGHDARRSSPASGEVVLRVVPGGLREAGLALGASRWRTVWRRAAHRPARARHRADPRHGPRGRRDGAGAAHVRGVTFFNANPFNEPDELAAAVHLHRRSAAAEPHFIARGYGAASVLLLPWSSLFAIIRLLARSAVTR